MRSLFGNLKRKLNSDRTWGKSALSLFLAALMLFSTLSSVVFAESNRTETVTEAETWFDTSAVTEALLGEPPAADAIATDATDATDTEEPGTEASETDAPAVEPTQVEWTVDIDGSEYAVISGVLPEDGSATVEPAAIPRGSETTFSAYDLTVYDGEGEVYAPEDSLAVELHSEKIAETLAEGNSVGVLEKNRYGYFTTAETVSVSGDSVKFMAEENSTYYLYANQLVKTLVASDGNTYRITVLYDADSGFPEDAEIRAEEVSLDSEDYVTYLENAAATLGVELSALTYNRLFDIAIVDAAGTEYQPNDSVRVTVEMMESEAESVENLRVVHFDDENVPTELDASTSRGAVTFETDGFSIFSFNDTSLASRVINAIFGDSKLYENDDIILTGRMPLLGTVEATPVNVQVDGRDALIAYDIKIYANSIMKLLGIPWQPSEGAVQVTVKSDVFADADGVLSVYHMQDEQSEPEFVASVDAVDSAVTFDAESFSIYAVGSVIEKTIVAEDGYTYKITVTFDESAGIPADAELSVSEISCADMLRTAAETVGSGVESISYAKMFDISIVKDGVEYQPNENVKVSVELLDAGEVSDVQVVHFDSETEAAPLAAETDGNTVTFETEGFSVFSFLDFSVFDEIISAVLGETEGVLYENDDIILTGKMPATAVVEANRVDVDIKGKPALIAYDIKIYAHPVMKLLGINWQPTEGAIKVSLKSDALAGHNNLKVYHMADLDSEPELVSRVHIPDSTVEFDAESFSVYPIGEAETPPRIFYTFFNGSTVLANEYVTGNFNSNTGELEAIIGFYNPGVSTEYGQTFLGWAINNPAETDETKMYEFDSEDPNEITLTTKLQEVLSAQQYEDGEEIKVYAKFKESYYLRYLVMNGDGQVYVLDKTDSVLVDAEDKTVTVFYDYSAVDEEFEGWIDAEGNNYQNGQEITLDHHIDLYAKLHGRYWLVFHANGTRATFTGPQLIYDEYVTHKPDDPTRRGYKFLGWNTKPDDTEGEGEWWYKTDGSMGENGNFGDTITADTNLYARWEGIPTNYYVRFWKQIAGTTGDSPSDYEYAESIVRTELTDTVVGVEESDKQKAGDEGYEHFLYNAALSDDTVTKEVAPDGTTTFNVYYKAQTYTLRFIYARSYPQNGTTTEYVTERPDDYTGAPYGLVNGNYVQLTDNNGTWEYRTSGTQYTGNYRYQETTSNSGTQYGVHSGGVNRVYYRNNAWRQSNNNYGTVYTGTRYLRGDNTGRQAASTDYDLGWVNNTMTQLYYDGNTWYVEAPSNVPYTGTLYYPKETTRKQYQTLNSVNSFYNATNGNGWSQHWEDIPSNMYRLFSGNTNWNNVTSEPVINMQPNYVKGTFEAAYGGTTYTYYYFDIVHLTYNQTIGDVWPQPSNVMEPVSTGNQTYVFVSWGVQVRSPYWVKAAGSENATVSGGSGKYTIKGPYSALDKWIFNVENNGNTEVNGDLLSAVFVGRYNTGPNEYRYHIYAEKLEGDTGTVRQYNGVDYTEISGSPYTVYSNDTASGQASLAVPGMDIVAGPLNNNNNTPSGSGGDIYYYYKRHVNNITFITPEDHLAAGVGGEEHTVPVKYGENISSYDEGGSNYYTPFNGDTTKLEDGYYFGGWYADQACTIPYVFDGKTMPDNNITVYAQIDTFRVRVVLNPGCTDFWFPNNQQLRFRLDYGEPLAFGNISPDVAKRPGYKLTGWYTTPDFQPGTEVDTSNPLPIQTNTPGLNTHYQQTSDWANNVYGDNDGAHNTVKGILKLYARWQLDLQEGAIYVIYEVEDGYCVFDGTGVNQTRIPVDPTAYTFGSTVDIKEAPSGYVDGVEFLDWMILTKDGGATSVTREPGGSLELIEEEWANFINVKTVFDENGNVGTMKTIRLRARFIANKEKATTIVFHGNGGTMYGGAETYTQVVPLNAGIELYVQSAAFTRPHYSIIGWATSSDPSAPGYRVFDIDEEIFADNEGLAPGEANHLYAVWQADIEIVATGPNEDVIYDGEPHSNLKSYTFSYLLGGDEISLAELNAMGIQVSISETGWPIATGTEKGEYVSATLTNDQLAQLIDVDDRVYRHGGDVVVDGQTIHVEGGGKLNIKRVHYPATLRIRDLMLTITKEVTGSFAEHNKPFTFKLVSVEGMTSGSFNVRIKRKIEGTTFDTTVAIGGTFWMRDGDTVEIIGLPKNKQVVIQEENGYYTTTWKLSSEENEGDLEHGNTMTVTLTNDSTLLVVNRYDPPAPTQVALKFAPFVITDLIGLALFALVWSGRKKRRGGGRA